MKTKPVVTRHRADEDVDLAFEHYLTEAGPDLAEAFIDEYERCVSHLSRFPLSGSPRLEHTLAISGIRHWGLRRFPFLIIYVDTDYAVEILRVLHAQTDIPTHLRDE